MAASKHKEQLVEVTHDGETVQALGEPVFIIRRGKKYFLTLALWEYEVGPGQTLEQQEGVAEVIALFDAAEQAGNGLEAVQLPNIAVGARMTQIKP